MVSCPSCGRAASMDATFCSACGARLDAVAPRTEPAPGSAPARKTVTVVFADVTGFTALGERLDPESLHHLMVRYLGEMRRVVERHGGTVEKFIGDAVMAIFGVPRLHEDDALRAARAALEMRATLEELNEELALGWDVRLRTHTGVNTGEVVIAATPDGDALTYGDAVNVAQRLESEAAPGAILVGETTERLLRGSARLAPVAALELKGRAAHVRAWRLEAVLPAAPAARSERSADLLVDRTEELGALRGAFEAAAGAGRAAMVTVVGPAGIGKSRLARALAAQVAGRGTVVVGRCLPYGEGITYGPLREIVGQLSARADEAGIATLAGGDDEGRRIAARIARLVGFAPGSVAVEEAHWAVRRLLEIVARRRPLVVVVDDVHWAEPTLLDVLEHVAAYAAAVPLLAMCLARPELFDRRPAWAGLDAPNTIIPLVPLKHDDAATLLAELTAGAAVEAGERARLLAVAEGNPFFLEQMVATLAEPGAATAGMPATIQALLAARIDGLPPDERAVIDCAAVEGRTFHGTAVAALLRSGDPGALHERLDELVRRQLVRPRNGAHPGADEYRFAHGLVRDVAYGLVPKVARADLHERYAGWLERRAGEAGDELIGYHLEQAHRWHAELRPNADGERRTLATAAARRLRAAGHAALERGDLPAGVNLLERAVALLPADAPARGATLPELGLALVQLGRLSDADALLEAAARRAAAEADAVAEAHALAARFFAQVQMQSAAAARELGARFDALRETFAAAEDDLGLSRLWRAQGLVHWLAGRSADAEGAWMRGVEHAAVVGDEQGRTDALAWVASAVSLGPTPVPAAIPRCEAIVEQLHADRHSAALSMRPLAHLHAMAGRFDVAYKLLRRSTAILADLGVSMHSAVSHDEAFVALLAGDHAGAEAVLRQGYEQLEAMGERALLATTAALLARVMLAQDRDEEAWTFTDAAAATAAADDLNAEIVYGSVRAELLARRGALAEAARLSAEAVRLAAQTDWVVDHADALMAHAAVQRAAGKPEVAIVTVRRALAMYEHKGNVVSAGRARDLARRAA